MRIPHTMVRLDEVALLCFAQLSANAVAMNDAALDANVDEARFRTRIIADWAIGLGLPTLADAALEIERILDLPCTEPGAGYGDAMLALADLLTPP